MVVFSNWLKESMVGWLLKLAWIPAIIPVTLTTILTGLRQAFPAARALMDAKPGTWSRIPPMV